MILTETPRRKLVTQLVNWGHWFALLNIFIAITIAGVYILNSPAPDTALGAIYLLTNWVSHIGFLTFFAFVILILPLCYLLPNAKAVKVTSSMFAALGLALLGFDALLYNKYGVHLSFNSAELIKHEAQTVMAQFGWQQWGFLLFLFLAWLSFQLVLANALWQRIDRLQKRKLGLPISSAFMACFVASHAMHVWADANLYQPIVQQDNMFPISYPATAKTLMARYSLLDIEDYQQRKSLQFNHKVDGISYPSEPVYCSVNSTNKVLILAVTDGKLPLTFNGLTRHAKHFGFHSTVSDGENSILYGLPELYHQALQDYIPILFSLPNSMGLKVSLYAPQNSQPKLQSFMSGWQQFSQTIQNTDNNLAVGFIQAEQLAELLTPTVLSQYQVIITDLNQQDELTSSLFTNFVNNKGMSSQEDIAPTALSLLGCQAKANSYSTGSSLTVSNGPKYLVSTQGSKVLLLDNQHKTEIMNNGNVKIFDLRNNQEVFKPVDTNLLSQGIKHLSRFSAKRSYTIPKS
jgi:membrane-anchored protein YejM (alkaline phosphatase superfamily)